MRTNSRFPACAAVLLTAGLLGCEGHDPGTEPPKPVAAEVDVNAEPAPEGGNDSHGGVATPPEAESQASENDPSDVDEPGGTDIDTGVEVGDGVDADVEESPPSTPAPRTERDGRTVLQAHNEPVLDLAFSADGRRLASLSARGEVAIWDVPTWTRRTFALPGDATFHIPHRGPGEFLAFSPNGDTLVCGSTEQVHLWDVADGKLRASLGREPQYYHTLDLALSADGRIAAVFDGQNDGGQAVLVNVAKGTRWCTFDDAVRRQFTRRLALSPDGAILAMSCDLEVRLFDVRAKKELSSVKGMQGEVLQLAFTADDGLLLCREANRLSAFVVAREPDALPQFEFREEEQVLGVEWMSLLPDPKALAFFGQNQIVLWDRDVKEPRVTVAAGRQLVASPGMETLVALEPSYGNKIILADGETGLTFDALDVPLPAGRSESNGRLALSPDGALLAVGTQPGEIVLFDLSAARPTADPQVAKFDTELGFSPANNARLQFSPSGHLLIVTTTDSATLFDMESKELRCVLEDPSWAPYSLQWPAPLVFSADEKYASTISNLRSRSFQGGWQNRFIVYDAITGKPDRVETQYVGAMTAAPDGKLVVVYTTETVELRDVETGEVRVLCEADQLTGQLHVLCFSPDGKYVAAVAGGSIKLWETETGKPKAIQADGGGGGTTFCGNKTLVVSDGYFSLQLYDVASGSLRKELLHDELRKAHIDNFTRLRVCETQPLLVTCGSSDVLLRDLETGQVLGRCVGHSGDVYTAVFSRDGKHLATAGADNTVRVWDVATLRGDASP
jgi:WD40 repeat protein